MGKASGINYMAQRLGAVFAVAIGTAVFNAYGGLGDPELVTQGFRPAMWACTALAGLAAISAMAMSPRRDAAPDGLAAEATVGL
jgi:hypothetical protein